MANRDSFSKRKKGKSFTAAQLGSVRANNYTEATDAMVDGMEKFLQMAERVANKEPHFQRGHLFETIIAAKKNVEAAVSNSSLKTHVTHLKGDNTSPADLEYRLDKSLVGEAQAKFSAKPPDKIAEMIVDSKYNGMDRYVPSNKVDEVRESLLRKANNCTNSRSFP